MKKEAIVKLIQKASSFKTAVRMATENDVVETALATPGTVFGKVDHILWAIADAKNNKAHLMKFVPIVKQLTKVLNGADATFIRHSEFYHDLKETLNKIEQQIIESKTRNKWSNKLMAKKDLKVLEEIEQHVEHLITRIVFAFAQRAKFMNMARKKKHTGLKQPLDISSIEEEDENECGKAEDLKEPER
ncbi:uncharacterized protein LOC110236311 [Exaiptasia diaphana]|uniref:Uncharacterized protein n=1 Tax=Exaiptasia diaphana TaxID=2652724 RepID=A0A913X1L4_EXADI|nr:uncharacterized protein LOC110236311 [Exaiptasia diaphana]